jgi:predicted nucleic acid-binding protein
MVIADTGFWLALANRKDRHHHAARQRLEGLDEGLVTTWPVVTEANN